ncbi:hypothetical protein ACQEVI_05770 [Promicromonospora sp. CA-289599]|uniref:hypothetical protein n=1 Tax=Promicromonospora sp. CA-289599 TaxID=3240014 RepID=UPI003D8F0A62
MGKSASVLGFEFGRTAREMNELFKQHGYLEGEPGAYRLTDKGSQYAEEQYHSRGTGGYAHYNRSWETRTWNDATIAALQTDMGSDLGGATARDAPIESVFQAPTLDYEPFLDDRSDGDGAQFGWRELAIAGTLVGAILVAPHVKAFYHTKMRPATAKWRDKLAKREPVELRTLDSAKKVEEQASPVAPELGIDAPEPGSPQSGSSSSEDSPGPH